MITFKDQECQANFQHIDQISEAVKVLKVKNYDVIVIHGAGSFGHLKAKRWRLQQGKIYGPLISNVSDEEICSQEEAVEAVQKAI